MPTNPDPTQGNRVAARAESAEYAQDDTKGTAKGGLLNKLKALQETINDLQQQLSDITDELEGTN